MLFALFCYFGSSLLLFGGCSTEKREHFKSMETGLRSYRKKTGNCIFVMLYPGFRFYQNLKYYIRMVTNAFRGRARRIAFASFSGMQIKISGV